MSLVQMQEKMAYGMPGASMRFICPECGGSIRSASFKADYGDAGTCKCRSVRRSIDDSRRPINLLGFVNRDRMVSIDDICMGGVGISVYSACADLFPGNELLFSIFHDGTEITVRVIVRHVINGKAGLQFLHLDEYQDVQRIIKSLVDFGENAVIM